MRGEISRTETHTPVGVEGCDQVPFQPTAEVTPETATSDQPDGADDGGQGAAESRRKQKSTPPTSGTRT